MRVAFSHAGSGLEDEPSLQQLKFVHAPLLRAGSGWALALPQHRRPRPSGPGAHLFVLPTASHSCGTGAGRHWLPCRSDMGKKLSTARQQGGAGRGREGQGALPLSKITACMHTVPVLYMRDGHHGGAHPPDVCCAGQGVQDAQGAGRRSAPRALFTRRIQRCLPSPPSPGHSYSGPRILRGYAYHLRDNEKPPARQYCTVLRISDDGFTVAPLIRTIQNVAAANILEGPDRHLAILPEILQRN
jgi:hypothetical protein